MKKLILFALMVGLAVCISYCVDPDKKDVHDPEAEGDNDEGHQSEENNGETAHEDTPKE